MYKKSGVISAPSEKSANKVFDFSVSPKGATIEYNEGFVMYRKSGVTNTPSEKSVNKVFDFSVSPKGATIEQSENNLYNKVTIKNKVDFCKDGIIRQRLYTEKSFENAKKLRSAKNTTEAEKLMWYYLKDKKVSGFKFRRQHPVGNYILDFVCIEKKLIIEIDGGQHNESKNIVYDKERSKYFVDLGYRVLRFWNNDVFKNMNGVLYTIYDMLSVDSKGLI